MKIRQFDIWIADLNPRIGTEPGKTRPVIIVQTNLLNSVGHPSTIICPITTGIQIDAEILRAHIKKGEGGLSQDSDILVDQIRAIDNRRLTKKIGTLPKNLIELLKENISVVLDL